MHSRNRLGPKILRSGDLLAVAWLEAPLLGRRRLIHAYGAGPLLADEGAGLLDRCIAVDDELVHDAGVSVGRGSLVAGVA